MSAEFVCDVGSSSDPCNMSCKVPSLPDLLRKTLLTFCEGSVKFQKNLEVIGSLHIRSDNDRVVTFLLDEQLQRENALADSVTDGTQPHEEQEGTTVLDVTPSDNRETDVVNLTASKREVYTTEYTTDRSSRPASPAPRDTVNTTAYPHPKKPRKILKPIKKIYGSLGESTDADSEMDVGDNGNNNEEVKQDYIISQPPPIIRKQDYLDSPVNDNLMPNDVYRRGKLSRSDAVVGAYSPSPATSPQPPQLEVSSTRPDDSFMPPRQSSTASDTSVMSQEEMAREVSHKDNLLTVDTRDPRGYVDRSSRSPSIKIEEPTNLLTPHSSGHGSLTPSSDIAAMSEHHSQYSVSPQPYASSAHTTDDRQPPMLIKEGYIQRSFDDPAGPPHTELGPLPGSDVRRMMYPIMNLSSYHSSTDSGYSGYYGDSKDSSQLMGQSSLELMHGKDNYSCPEPNCGKVLKTEKMLELHMNTAHTHKNIYPCKQCGKKFYAASSLHSHKRRTHDEQKYRCPYCPRCYAFQSELAHHMETVHPHFPINSAAAVAAVAGQSPEYGHSLHIPPEMPKYPELGQVAQVHHLLSAFGAGYPPPQLAHINQTSTESDPGPAPSDSQPQLPFHSLSQDSMSLMPEDPERNNSSESQPESQPVRVGSGVRFKCSDCGLLLKSRECLALHVNAKHTQKLSYPCNVCGKIFYAPSSRFCHMRRVHASPDQKFHCTYCEKVFSFHYELRNHMKMWHRQKLIQRSDGVEGNEGEDQQMNGQQQSPSPAGGNPPDQEPEDQEQKMPCNYCEKSFSHHYDLCNHMKMAHGMKLMQQSESMELDEPPVVSIQADEEPSKEVSSPP